MACGQVDGEPFVLLGIGLWIVGRVAQPIGWWRLGLLAAMWVASACTPFESQDY
jgi:hypothetical protein